MSNVELDGAPGVAQRHPVGRGQSFLIALVALVAPMVGLHKSMWRDEGATIYSARLTWSQLWQQSHVVDRVLLLYYSLVHAWIAVSGSIEWVRLLSVASFGVTVYLVGRIGAEVGGAWCAAVAAATAGTNPLLLDYAVQARPYALATLSATSAIYCLFRWRDDGGVRWTWRFAGACVLTLLLQFFIIIAPLSVLGAMLVSQPRSRLRQLREVLLPTVLVMITALVYLSLVASQQKQVAWIPRQSIVQIVFDVAGLAVIGHHLVYAVAVTVSALWAFAVVVRHWRSGRLAIDRQLLRNFFVALVWMLAPPIALEVISLDKPSFIDRYVIASSVGMALVLGIVVASALRGATLRAPFSGVGVAALAALSLVMLFESHVSASAVDENFRGAAQYLAVNVGTGVVTLPDHSLTEGVVYYWPSARRPIPLWPELTDQVYIEGLDLRESRAAFTTAPRDVWLVQDYSVRGESRFIAELGRRGYRVVGLRHFDGREPLLVLHYRRTAG